MGILEGQPVRIRSTGQTGKLQGIEWQDRWINGSGWHSKLLAAVILDGARNPTVHDAADVGAVAMDPLA